MYGVEKFGVEMSSKRNFSTPDFSTPDLSTLDFSTMNFPTPDFQPQTWGWKVWLRNLGLKSSFLLWGWKVQGWKVRGWNVLQPKTSSLLWVIKRPSFQNWDLRLSELFIFQKSITLTDEELVWRDFLVWLDQTIAMSCSMVIGEISRGSILSESSKNVMGSSFDPRSHMRLHLLRFQICSFWHAITLGSSLCGQPEELLCNWNY